ncbi:hypothetical protein Tco_0063172, partial [Tanacetum coccineum]
DKHIELVNIIGNRGAGILTRAMAKELGAALAHECIFVDFLFEEEPKSTNGVSTASTYLELPELVNTARRVINTADGQSC